MTRKELIMYVEKRISSLIIIMDDNLGLTGKGLLPHKYGIAYEEWRLLKDTSTKLQEISKK